MQCRVSALRGALKLPGEPDYPDRTLTLYWLGPFRRALVQCGLGNQAAETELPFYASVFRTARLCASTTSPLDPGSETASSVNLDLPMASLPVAITARSRSVNWRDLVSSGFPSAVLDFQWRLPGVVARRGVRRTSCSPNCPLWQILEHAVRTCPVEYAFHTLVGRMFAFRALSAHRPMERLLRLAFAVKSLVLLEARHLPSHGLSVN